MNNKAYLRLLTLPIIVTSLVLYAGDNPDLRCFIDSANRSLHSRQFDRAINDLIPALRVAKRERASNESVSAILSNLGYSYRMLGRCGDAVTALTEEMRGWDRRIVALDQARFAGINLLQSYLDCRESRSAARLWRKTLIPITRKLNPDSPALASLFAAGALATSAVKQYQESVNLYNEAITIWGEQPENYRDRICSARSNRAVAHAYLGEILAAIDDADRALKEIDSAIAMEPAVRAVALNNIAVVYLMDKRFTEAEDCLRRTLALVDGASLLCEPQVAANYAFLLRQTAAREPRQLLNCARRNFPLSAVAKLDHRLLTPAKLIHLASKRYGYI
jgi:tetratricopeptide (TPR) repeat protein